VDRLRAHPGVRDVAYGNSFPLNIDQSATAVSSDDRRGLSQTDAVGAVIYQVSPDYFRTLGIRILHGRDFRWQDSDGGERVAVINEALAKRVLGEAAPIGRRIRLGSAAITVVGVVETGKYQALTEAERPAIFEPMLQAPNTTTVILARSHGSGTELASVVRQVVREADPALPLMGVRSVKDAIGFVRLPMQAAALALSAFGMLAAALAATGIHGVVAYAVSRRRRELAIRVALGAPGADLVRLVVRHTFVLVVIGTVAGVALTFGLRSVLATVLYMPGAESIWSWALVLGLVTFTSLVACAWPTWRALTVDPATALVAE
jgi:ABC-type antimicrobial peptide transport system permease subunit